MKTPHLFELAPQLLEISGARRNSSSAFIFQIAIAGSRQIKQRVAAGDANTDQILGRLGADRESRECMRRRPMSPPPAAQ